MAEHRPLHGTFLKIDLIQALDGAQQQMEPFFDA